MRDVRPMMRPHLAAFPVRAGQLGVVASVLLAAVVAVEIPLWIAAGHLLLVIGLIASPPLLYLCYRWRAILTIVLLTLVFVTSDDAILQTGFPDLGINLVDIVVLAMGGVLALHYVHTGLHDLSRAYFALVVLLVVGLLQLAIGLALSSPPRTAFRDLRFFVYVPVIIGYLLAWRRVAAVPLALLVVWYLLVAAEWVELLIGVLVLHPGAVIGDVPVSASSSPLHFVNAAAFVPLLVSLGALLLGRQRALAVVFHSGVVLISALVLVLSFGRSLWLSVGLVGVGTVAIACRRHVVNEQRWVGALWVLAVAVAALVALWGLGVLEPTLQRAAEVLTISDSSSLSRFEDDNWTLWQSLMNPLGHGLGNEPVVPVSGYLTGLSLHMGYLWLLYRGGALALLVFAYVLVNSLRTAFQRRSIDPISVGLAATLLAWSTMAAASTFMLSFMAIPFWGFLIGLTLGYANQLRNGAPDRRASVT